MPSAPGILHRISGDPALGYMAFAAVFLAAVSVAAGLARGDVLALRRPLVAIKLTAAVGIAIILAHLVHLLAEPFGWTEATWWRPAGAFRWPLYVAALAYGPSLGILVGLGYLGAAAIGLTPEPSSAILPVELAVVGWLAIFPSPWRWRWAGPFDAAAGYALAWGTVGLTLLVASEGVASAVSLAEQHAGRAAGALLAAVALFGLRPAWYRRFFPETRIHAGETVPSVDAQPGEGN